MDDASLSVLQREAAAAAGLPVSLSNRLAGGTIGELTRDAGRMVDELGLRPPQPRDQRGRFAGGAMSDLIRQAAGRPTAPTAKESRSAGSGRLGEGGTAAGRRPQPVDMNAAIRGAVAGRRSVAHQFAEQFAIEEADG